MSYNIAGIDVHKKLLVVVIVAAEKPEEIRQSRRFGTGAKELHHLLAWLCQYEVAEAVMESTAQYWKPVWLEGYKGLSSIKGIGKITGAILLSVIGDVSDFADEGHLASYFGIVPRVSNSNETEHSGRIQVL